MRDERKRIIREYDELVKRAEKAGVAIEEVVCPHCDGAGLLAHPDPIDLRRHRESRGWTQSRFAREAVKGGGERGFTFGYISMVEGRAGSHSRRCRLQLLRQYLDLPQRPPEDMDIPPAKKYQSLDPPPKTLEEGLARQRDMARRAMERRRRKYQKQVADEKTNPPKKGSLWEKVRGTGRLGRRVLVQGVVDGMVVTRGAEKEGGPQYSTRLHRFLLDFREVGERSNVVPFGGGR